MWFAVGKGVNVEGAVPSEQEVNQPKPAKRARTSFTADQLQVNSPILRNVYIYIKKKGAVKRLIIHATFILDAINRML